MNRLPDARSAAVVLEGDPTADEYMPTDTRLGSFGRLVLVRQRAGAVFDEEVTRVGRIVEEQLDDGYAVNIVGFRRGQDTGPLAAAISLREPRVSRVLTVGSDLSRRRPTGRKGLPLQLQAAEWLGEYAPGQKEPGNMINVYIRPHTSIPRRGLRLPGALGVGIPMHPEGSAATVQVLFSAVPLDNMFNPSAIRRHARSFAGSNR